MEHLVGSLGSWIDGLDVQIQSALLAAAATTVVGLVGFAAVVIQIGHQARSAIHQARDNERQTLKLKIYERVIDVCAKAVDATLRLRSYLTQINLAFVSAAELQKAINKVQPPSVRAMELSALQGQAHVAAVGIISLVEQWRIVDPRLGVFQTAMNVAIEDAFNAFHEGIAVRAIKLLPMEGPDGKVLPWKVPDHDKAEEFRTASNDLTFKLELLGCYIDDFQNEMQQLLLGDLFPGPATRRKPLDPSLVVVTLEDHAELTEWFESETAWGRRKRAAEERALADIDAKRREGPEA